MKIRYRIKETLQFLTFAFYPKITLIACAVFSVIVVAILGIVMMLIPKDADSYNMVFALTTGAAASFFVTFVVELANNYRHNKLAWYELQEYYLTIMNYESYKQIMMQRTPHQRAENKAYEEFVAAGGIEEKEAPKDIIQITWEQLPDLISVLRRTFNDKKEFLSDAEIDELQIILSEYESIQFAIKKSALSFQMTYDLLNHPDEDYLEGSYSADVIRNMPERIRRYLARKESQEACERYVDAILSDSFLISEVMANYDISQNGLDSYSDEIDHMEESEVGEPEDIDEDEVDFSEPEDEEAFRMQREEFEEQMKLEQRPFTNWLISKCCKDIADSLDVLEKSIRKKPYYGIMIKHYNNCAREPLDDMVSMLSYESEKRRLDRKLAKQNMVDNMR